MDEKHLKYIRIKRYVNKIKFSGILMGGTLNDQFQNCEIYGIPSVKATIKDLFKEALRVLFSLFRKKSFIMNTSVIGTWINYSHHYTNIMVPLIEHYNKNITVVYNPKIKNVDQLYNANFISIRKTFITPVNNLPYLIRFILVL